MFFIAKLLVLKITSILFFYLFKLQRLNIENIQISKNIMFSIPPSNQVSKTSFHPYSQKLLPLTPSNKTNLQGHKAVKKLLNYSYALNEEVGLGLTSKVFKGKNDLTGTPVAIKCIDVKKQNDSLSQEFLKEEINVLDRIKSIKANYLLKLQAVLLTANNLYIVTEFCDGKDVSKILRQRKQLSQQQAQTIMKQLIWGYRQLYSLGLIHRDLKLSNLLVSNGKIKLADFGFAINEDKCNANFSYNVGSPKYMPPQTLKFNKYSFKSDLWAIGVMAYQLVYGSAPWKSNIDSKLYEMIFTTPIENLFDPNISVSDHYKTFIVNCLRPNINERPGPDFLYNYSWPLSGDFVQGYQEQKKMNEVIKLPGKNYAVYTSSNQIQYEDKQLDLKDFVNNSSVPSQFILLSRLNYCKFLLNIFKNLSSLKQSNQLVSALSQEIGMTIQIITKILGQTACMQINRIQASGFQSYIKTAEWKNLKQIIIRYDIQFREALKALPPLRKNATIPQSSALPQLISYLKKGLSENARLIDKLITFLEIRQLFINSKPLQFAQTVPMANIVEDYEIPDHNVNGQTLLNRVVQRLSMNGL